MTVMVMMPSPLVVWVLLVVDKVRVDLTSQVDSPISLKIYSASLVAADVADNKAAVRVVQQVVLVVLICAII